MSITCFLPCRSGSERVKNKNIRPFAGFNKGLIEIKLKQLEQVDLIDKIILSTNDVEIITFAKTLNIEKLVIHEREESLCSSQTSTDEIINMVGNLITEGHVLWTHVTSPFINGELYTKILDSYLTGLEEGYDSLMTTSEIRSFVWDESGPINYDRHVEKWPRTQTLPILHEINSGAFVTSVDTYREMQDRIGKNVKYYPLSKIEGHDIDWPEDFIIAESLLQAKLGSI